jgi:hypothetical protein
LKSWLRGHCSDHRLSKLNLASGTTGHKKIISYI